MNPETPRDRRRAAECFYLGLLIGFVLGCVVFLELVAVSQILK